ncbi:MAG: hypothetical protein K2J76_05970, partial [Oscillospiraceae bacterium]|nr:hypothetical protein [Oscillospiraceae bacterium]
DTDYTLPAATETFLGGVMTDGSTISANGGIISVADNSHGHTIANVAGLQDVLDGKADISAIPTSLPANGGNAATVGGFTVGTNVPSNAKFTDTVYTLPKASTSVLGGVKVDGTTITANASGIISALASGGSGITVDKVYEDNFYWQSSSRSPVSNRFIKLPYAYTRWNYLLITLLHVELSSPWFANIGTILINTQHIVNASRDPSTFAASKANMQYLFNGTGANASYIDFPNTTHIHVSSADQVILWGITMPSQSMIGSLVMSATA